MRKDYELSSISKALLNEIVPSIEDDFLLAKAHNQLARVFEKEKDFKKALEHYEIVLEKYDLILPLKKRVKYLLKTTIKINKLKNKI